MKAFLYVATMAAAATTAAPAMAQTRSGLEVGIEGFGYGYREFVDGDLLIQDKGSMAGLHLSYVQPLARGLFVRGILAGAAGEIDYDPLDEPVIEDIEQRTGRLEAHLGYDVRLGRYTTLTPFVGYGFRLLEDLSAGRSTASGLRGYDREITYHYVPVGLAVRIPVGARPSLTVSAQYNHLIGGSALSKFAELDSRVPNVELDFTGGHGLEASAMLSVPVGRHAINVGPFIRRWSIADSEDFSIANPDDPTEVLVLREPENRTTEVGLRVSFSF